MLNLPKRFLKLIPNTLPSSKFIELVIFHFYYLKRSRILSRFNFSNIFLFLNLRLEDKGDYRLLFSNTILALHCHLMIDIL